MQFSQNKDTDNLIFSYLNNHQLSIASQVNKYFNKLSLEIFKERYYKDFLKDTDKDFSVEKPFTDKDFSVFMYKQKYFLQKVLELDDNRTSAKFFDNKDLQKLYYNFMKVKPPYTPKPFQFYPNIFKAIDLECYDVLEWYITDKENILSSSVNVLIDYLKKSSKEGVNTKLLEFILNNGISKEVLLDMCENYEKIVEYIKLK